MKLPLTVIVLTFNEEKNIEATLSAAKQLTDDILLVDSYSTDNTLNIAQNHQVHIIQNKFKTHTLQWKYAFENNPFENEWILALDADQVVSLELTNDIYSIFKNGHKADGYFINRKMYFLGRWIRHGGYYPLYMLKMFRKQCVYLDEGELMEHHFYLNGQTAKLKGFITEANKNETLEFWLNKHIKYAKLQATEEASNLKDTVNRGSLFGDVAARKLFIRKRIWEKMPLFARPLVYFIYRYIFLLGFLDGKQGLIFHYLQAFWYRFTVDSLIYEIKNNAKN